MATAVRAIVMMIFIVVFVLSIGKGSQLAQLTSKDMGFMILSGIAGALSWLCYFVALRLADVSQVAPIDRASLSIAIVLAALVLGEKITLKSFSWSSHLCWNPTTCHKPCVNPKPPKT